MWLKFGPITAVICCLLSSGLSSYFTWQYKTTVCDNAILNIRNKSDLLEIKNLNNVRGKEWKFIVSQQGVINEAKDRQRIIENDINSLAGTAEQLRNETSRIVPKRSPGEVTPVNRDHAATATKLVLFTQLFESASDRATNLAAEAESYRVAGESCVLYYNEVMKITNSQTVLVTK